MSIYFPNNNTWSDLTISEIRDEETVEAIVNGLNEIYKRRNLFFLVSPCVKYNQLASPGSTW